MNSLWCEVSKCVFILKGCLTSFFVSDADVAALLQVDDSVEQEIEDEVSNDMTELGLNKDNEGALAEEAGNFFNNLDLVHKEQAEFAGEIPLDEVEEKEDEVLAEENEEEALDDEQMAAEDEMLAEEDLEATKEDENKVFLGGEDADYWAEKKAFMSHIPLCHK